MRRFDAPRLRILRNFSWSFLVIMTDQLIQEWLDQGWTRELKRKEVWEFRCPCGSVCGKNQKLMYVKDSEDLAVTAGAWHLYDTQFHSDFQEWSLAREKALDGDHSIVP